MIPHGYRCVHVEKHGTSCSDLDVDAIPRPLLFASSETDMTPGRNDSFWTPIVAGVRDAEFATGRETVRKLPWIGDEHRCKKPLTLGSREGGCSK